MKILLSAYACKPGEGSEPGIGWGWVQQLLLNNHEVWVITPRRNRRAIEEKLAITPLEKAHFIYFDLPRLIGWSSISRIWPFKFGEHLFWQIWHYPYHYFWQLFAYKNVKHIVSAEKIDVVHHVTYATLARSSFMGELGIPFILGPVGGGERAPFRIRKFMSVRGWLLELVRDISILVGMANPFIWRGYSKASIIYATTWQSKMIVPKRYRNKVVIKSQLGIDDSTLSTIDSVNRSDVGPIRFLYVGRFIYWKGIELGLRAFAELCKELDNVEMTLIGRGPDEQKLREFAERLGVSRNINWKSWVKQSELKLIYQNHDVFLFPSLHDSGGLAVIEAMANYLPVICLGLGGPATSVNNNCGTIVDADEKDPDEIVDELFQAMRDIVANKDKRIRLSLGAYKRAKEFRWPAVISDINYDTIINSVDRLSS